MKTIRYFAAALTVIAAASCQDTIAPEQEYKTTTFHASFDPQTKISLGEKDASGNVQALWDGEEKISIFDDINANISFSGTASKSKSISFSSSKGTFSEGKEYYAVYPYHSKHSFSEGTITSCYGNVNQIPDDNHLPCELTNTERKLTFACAYGTKENLSFHHIYALVKFTIERDNVYCVTLVNGGTDKIATAANFTISYSDGKFTPSFIDKGTIYYYADSSRAETTFFAPGTYYIAVRPCDLQVKIKLNGESYKQGKSTHTLKPGMILDLGLLE